MLLPSPPTRQVIPSPADGTVYNYQGPAAAPGAQITIRIENLSHLSVLVYIGLSADPGMVRLASSYTLTPFSSLVFFVIGTNQAIGLSLLASSNPVVTATLANVAETITVVNFGVRADAASLMASTSASLVSELGDVGSAQKGGVAILSNADPLTCPQYGVVIGNAGSPSSFLSTTIQGDRRILGVASSQILTAAQGTILTGPQGTNVLTVGTIAISQWLIASGTAWKAAAYGYNKPPGAIGLALTADNGSLGYVYALLNVDLMTGLGVGRSFLAGDTTTLGQVQKWAWATETASLDNTMATGLNRCSGGNSSSTGYTMGGYNGSTQVTTIEALNLSTELWSVLGATIGTVRYQAPGVGNTATTVMYMVGGDASGAGSGLVDKLTYSTSTDTSLGAIATALYDRGGCQNSTKGIVAGGNGPVSSIGKMTFASDSYAVEGAVLSSARQAPSGIGDQTANGFFCGGLSSAVTDEFNFSSETCAAASGANLLANNNNYGGMSALNYGYVIGLTASGTRIAYATATASACAGLNTAQTLPASNINVSP